MDDHVDPLTVASPMKRLEEVVDEGADALKTLVLGLLKCVRFVRKIRSEGLL